VTNGGFFGFPSQALVFCGNQHPFEKTTSETKTFFSFFQINEYKKKKKTASGSQFFDRR
jgi:hypothetical protein